MTRTSTSPRASGKSGDEQVTRSYVRLTRMEKKATGMGTLCFISCQKKVVLRGLFFVSLVIMS